MSLGVRKYPDPAKGLAQLHVRVQECLRRSFTLRDRRSRITLAIHWNMENQVQFLAISRIAWAEISGEPIFDSPALTIARLHHQRMIRTDTAGQLRWRYFRRSENNRSRFVLVTKLAGRRSSAACP